MKTLFLKKAKNTRLFSKEKTLSMKSFLFLVALTFILSAYTGYRHKEKEHSPGNKDAKIQSIINKIYKRHVVGTKQPGIDIPRGGIEKGRIAIESDGNVFASDDLGAIPFGIGILHKTGHLGDIVHIGYNNNPNPDRHVNKAKDDLSLGQDVEFRAIMKKTTNVFGLNPTIVFDYNNSAELSKATANLVKEINASSAANPLYIIQAGAMIYLYNALAASNSDKHNFVTVITHSGWNDIECHDSKLNENIIDILRDFKSVKFDYIIDQNRGLRSKTGWAKIAWMNTSNDPVLKWLHTCAKKGDPNRWGFFNLSSEVDISDAGMFYYLVTGKEKNSSFASFKTLLSKHNLIVKNDKSKKSVQKGVQVFMDSAKDLITVVLDKKSSKLEIYDVNSTLVYRKANVSGEIIIPKSQIGKNGYYIMKVNNITKVIYL